MAWRLERPRFSRISSQASASRSRSAPAGHAACASGSTTRPSRSSTWRSAKRGDVRVVGHENDAVALAVQLLEEGQDLLARARVESPGGLVGEEERGTVGQGARDGHPLALAAGELGGQRVRLLLDPDLVEQLQGALAALLAPDPRVEQRQLHVAGDRGPGQQVVGLEDEAELLVPDPGQGAAGEALNGNAVELVGSGGRRVEAADDRHQRRLARARRPHQGHELAALHREIDAAQRVHGRPVGAEHLGEAARLDDRAMLDLFSCHRPSRPSSWWGPRGRPSPCP